MPSPDASTPVNPLIPVATPQSSEGGPVSAPGRPPRPNVDAKTVGWMSAWWGTTEDLPHHDITVRAHEVCQQALHPAWYDDKDPFKGRALVAQRSREHDRLVRTPLIYLNNQQNVAQSVPETHDPKWKTQEQANPERLGADPTQKKFANSIRSVTKKYAADAGQQEVLEAWVADACNFPMSVLKIHFERELEREPLKSGIEQDGQDNLARIRQLSEDIARGTIAKDDARAVELADLLAGIGKTGEIEVREGLVVENLDLRRVRFPWVATLESIYLSPWISHDEDIKKRKLRALFPFKVTGQDAEGNITWEGIHPEDLEAATPCGSGSRKNHLENYDRSRSMKGGPTTGSGGNNGSQSDETKLMVREIWDRESGYVYVMVEGIPYPAAKWIPTKTPAQWYPFVFLVLNRVFGQVTGIADTELQADTQARIHRKQSDEELARYNCQPRGFIDSTMMDEKEQKEIVKSEPFSWKPLRLGGKGIEAMMKVFQWAFDPRHFDRSADNIDLTKEASLPQQALGGVGGPDAPHFAKEIEVAAAGSAISSNFRNSRIRRGLDRVYDLEAQILLQELDPEAAMAVDSTVFWPEFYSDQEAKAAYDQISKEVKAQVVHEVVRQIAPVDPFTGVSDPRRLDPRMLQSKVNEAAQPLIEAQCMQKFGLPRPMSRKLLYSQMFVRTSVVLDGELDRAKRLSGFTKGLESTAMAIQAAASAGINADWRPILRELSRLSGGDEDMAEEMFSVDANGAAKMLADAMQAGGQLSPEALALLQQLAPMVAQQAQQVMAAQNEKRPSLGVKYDDVGRISSIDEQIP